MLLWDQLWGAGGGGGGDMQKYGSIFILDANEAQTEITICMWASEKFKQSKRKDRRLCLKLDRRTWVCSGKDETIIQRMKGFCPPYCL